MSHNESPWSYWAGDLRTGKLHTELPVFSDSWEHLLNDAGSINIALALSDPDVRDHNPRLILEPGKSLLAVARGPRIFNAGPVWSHEYNPTTQVLQVKAANILSYFDYRYVYPLLNTNTISNEGVVTGPPADGKTLVQAKTVFTGKSLRAIAAGVVQQALAHSGGGIPISTQSYEDEAGSFSRTYEGHEMKTVAGVLRELSNEDSGPDFRFDAQFTNPGYIEWTMHIGSPYLGNEDRQWIFDEGANLREVMSVSRNGTALSNRTIVTGDGQDIALLNAVVQNDDSIVSGYPLLEKLINKSQEASTTVLSATATADTTLNNKPQEMWKVRVSASDDPPIESVRPGDFAKFNIQDDPYLGTTSVRARILGVSYPGPSAGGDQVDLTLGSVTSV